MDPLSQASLGASLSQSFANDRPKQVAALVIGALAGMAPDLDIFINSDRDPLLFLEYHRQFTHSLLFIPVGSLICALVFFAFIRLRWFRDIWPKLNLSFAQTYLFSFLAYATHGLLDSCTSYGTQLFWPFTDERVAWNTVSIIDPLFTLPVIVFISIAIYQGKPFFARIAFVYAVVFLSLGLVQKNRAEDVIAELALQRGHQIERTHVKPSFGNRHVWKLIYEYDSRYYVDAVKLLWDVEIIPGSSIQKLDVKRDFPWLLAESQQAKDIERFRWFSDDFLAVSTDDKNLVADVRYSFIPNEINPMFAIELNKRLTEDGDLDAHVFFEMKSSLDKNTRQRFLDMLF